MPNEFRSFSDLALEVGRFEVETIQNRGTREEKSVVGFTEANALGFFSSGDIFACSPEDYSASHAKLLDTLGSRVGKNWKLRSPNDEHELKYWNRLLATDQVLVFVAPNDERWIRNLIERTFLPFVATVPSMSLSDGWEKFERAAFSENVNGVHVASGGRRTTLTFVGSGSLFESAVSIAADLPPMMWGYTREVFKETLRSRKLIFRKQAAKTSIR